MEIERKFLVKEVPDSPDQYPVWQIEQAYLCTAPVVRIRRQNDDYILTWKGKGLLEREEYNLPLTREGYEHLRTKADGNVITKKRYRILLAGGYTAELDRFEGLFEGLWYVEVEFPSQEEAKRFCPPAWFGEDVTEDGRFQNSVLSRMPAEKIPEFLRIAEIRRKGGALC